MFLMSEFNSTLVMLANIYADGFDNRQTTKVYANGVMQVSIFVSVNYKGNSSGLEDNIKEYVQDNVVIYSLTDNGNMEKVDWDKSTSSNEFPHDLDYGSRGRSSSDKRAPLYFTVPPDSEGKYRWIAKLGEQETSVNTPVTIDVHEFQPLADGSQFEVAKRVKGTDDNTTLCVLRYKAGIFPDAQKLVKVYKYRGIKFTKTGGNSWLGLHNEFVIPLLSGIFLEYKEDHFNFAVGSYTYGPGDYESTGDNQKSLTAIFPPGNDIFSKQEIEDAWIDGVIIVQSQTLRVLHVVVPLGLMGTTHEFQDNFGNIVAIDFDVWDDSSDLKIKSAIVHYP